MPLIEPLETREVKKVSEFVIVIDTSMSCSGELVRRFLEETYGILSDSGNFFRKVNIHIIQCDEKVHSDVKITGREELQDYMDSLELYGDGGTDFRPAFAYVEELMEKREFDAAIPDCICIYGAGAGGCGYPGLGHEAGDHGG